MNIQVSVTGWKTVSTLYNNVITVYSNGTDCNVVFNGNITYTQNNETTLATIPSPYRPRGIISGLPHGRVNTYKFAINNSGNIIVQSFSGSGSTTVGSYASIYYSI